MKNIIIGTAGHIDHGKTTLIKALTGRSTDTLKEEIKRGISINLGFTYFDLPSGKRAGIIDVPGHEKFIRNMIAGASGIDIVLLTIAANEGIKPQTTEHVDILSYLDIKDCLIVLTKSSLADEIMKELVIEDVREQLSNTMFKNAEIVEVDSITGEGIEKLVNKLDELSDKVQARNQRANARLNIDRVFSSKGFGTIVTGTLVEGTINVDDELVVYPDGLKTKVRNIQVHEQNMPTAYAGQRTALNLANVKTDELKRGDILATPGALKGTHVCDVKLSLIGHTHWELKLWDRLRIYMGADEKFCRIVPLGTESIKAGESAFCQFRFEEEVFVKKNDRFVARTYSPMETVGGGVILDPEPKKHGRRDKNALESLAIKEKGDISQVIEEYVRSNSHKNIVLADIFAYTSGDEQEIKKAVAELSGQNGSIVQINKFYYHIDHIENIKIKALELLSRYHNEYPLRKGMAKEEIRSKLGSELKQKDFDALFKVLLEDGLMKYVESNFVALKDFEVVYSPEHMAIKNEIEGELLKGGFTPPSIEELTKNSKQRLTILESLYDTSIVKLDGQTVIHRDFYEKAKALLLEEFNQTSEITLAGFRDLINSSRKYCLLLLESFDNAKITARVGDKRVLLKK